MSFKKTSKLNFNNISMANITNKQTGNIERSIKNNNNILGSGNNNSFFPLIKEHSSCISEQLVDSSDHDYDEMHSVEQKIILHTVKESKTMNFGSSGKHLDLNDDYEDDLDSPHSFRIGSPANFTKQKS